MLCYVQENETVGMLLV